MSQNPTSACPSENALRASREIYWSNEWPGGSENYPDDLEEIITMARIIDKYMVLSTVQGALIASQEEC